MKIKKFELCLAIAICIIIAGCSANKTSKNLKIDAEEKLVDVIVVLPMENKTKDEIAPDLIRSKIIEELYFKGYEKLSPDFIDRKLESLENNEEKENVAKIDPQVLNDLIGADGVFYSTLKKSEKSIGFFYAPVTISISCELRKSANGEVIWKESYSATNRNFAFTRKGLEMKCHKTYEEVIEEVVTKIIETLPYGPNLRG